jgi:hypothetical protein
LAIEDPSLTIVGDSVSWAAKVLPAVALEETLSIILFKSAIIWSCDAINSLVILFSSYSSFSCTFIELILETYAGPWDLHYTDVDERHVDLTGSGSNHIPQTQPEYSGLSIALTNALSSAHSMEPYGDTGFLHALSSAMSSLSLFWHILTVLIIKHLFTSVNTISIYMVNSTTHELTLQKICSLAASKFGR